MVRALLIAALFLVTCDMPLQEKYGVYGMVTNPNAALTERARRGALRVSSNTVHRRPGTVEPRPGFATAYDLDFNIWRLLAFDGDMLAVGADEGGFRAHWLEGDVEAKDDTTTALQWAPDYVQAVQARGNLYLTTKDAVRKLTSHTDVAADRSGAVPAPPYVFVLNGGTGSVMTQNTNAAYRITASRTDANNVVITSAPSGRYILQSTNATAQYVSMIVYLGPEHLAGDTLRVYRSSVVAASVRPSDDLRLVVEHVITSAEISAGTVSLNDKVLDTERGASLYTNPTREGIERSNIVIPLSRDLALYRGSVFAARVKYPPYVDIAFSPGISTNRYTTTATRTNGSANVVVASATGLKVGQLFSSASIGSWSGSGPVRITAIAGTTITLSATWGGATDGAPVSVTFYDSIRVKSGTEDKYYLADSAVEMLASIGSNATGTTTVVRTVASTEVRAQGVNDVALTVNATDTTNGQRRSLRIQAILPSHAGFQVFATNGANYEPALPEPTVGTGYASSQDDFPNGVAWSKQDEPEHFMLSRYWLVGNKTPVLRIVAAGDSLYVFKAKGDGIYKLSGYGERSGWRVDQVSADTYLLHPDAIAVHEDTIFALTNHGIVAVNSAGISDAIDEPIADQTLDLAKDSEAFLTINTLRSFAAFAAYTRDDELVVGAPKTVPADEDEAHTVFVYNTSTRAWSTWFTGDQHRAAIVNPKDQLLYFADTNQNVLGERDRTTDPVITADASYDVTVSGVSDLTVTIAGGSGWTPHVGDLFQDSADTFAIVVSLDEGTPETVFTVSNAIVAGAGTAFEAFDSEIEWLPHFDPNGAMRKRYSSVYLHWLNTYGIYSWQQNVSGTGEGDEQEYEDTIPYDRGDRARDTRMLLNADVAFQSQLYTSLLITQAGARWEVGGMTLEARPAGRRVWQ